LNCAGRTAEAEALGRKYIRTAEVTNRNNNFYKAWIRYAQSLCHLGKESDAIEEEEKLAAEFLNNKNSVLPSDRGSIFGGMDLLRDKAPTKMIAFVKSELATNADKYASSPMDECWLRVFLARCYMQAGQNELATAEFLRMLHKAEKESARIPDSVYMRGQILTELIKLSKDDPSTQKEYIEEQKSLAPSD
jgi:hypothetical protein